MIKLSREPSYSWYRGEGKGTGKFGQNRTMQVTETELSQKLREKRVAGGEKRADPDCKHGSHGKEVILYPWNRFSKTLKGKSYIVEK